MFPLRLRKKQIVSYEWLLFKSEPAILILAKASVKEFSGVVLYLWRDTYLFWWIVKVFSEVEHFFQTLKFELGSSCFSEFLVSFSIKREVIEQLYYWAMTSITQLVSTESYFYRAYVNIQPTQRINMFATEHSNNTPGDYKN